jgi:hypothetical protein
VRANERRLDPSDESARSRVAAVRIFNVAVDQVGSSRTRPNAVIARGRDVATGWTISFVVPIGERDRVLGEVRRGQRPMVSVPEVDALPWASASGIEWE